MALLSSRLFYVLFVLVLDTIVYLNAHLFNFNWSILQWRFLNWNQSNSVLLQIFSQFDFFKFIFWFIIPLTFSMLTKKELNKEQSLKSWLKLNLSKKEILYCIGLFAVGAIAVSMIQYFPELRSYYPSQSHLNTSQKILLLFSYTLWTLSWLIGWEFLFRFYLISSVKVFTKKTSILLLIFIPSLETFYHIIQQKSFIESGAMFVFSFCATLWCLNKKNMILPFLAHFFIEVFLIFFLLFV